MEKGSKFEQKTERLDNGERLHGEMNAAKTRGISKSKSINQTSISLRSVEEFGENGDF